ncbi:MAG: hypothetical protein ACKV0T_21560 [Planctomycetales bacterium]
MGNLSVRGLQVGGTTSLIFDGEELGPTARLLLPFPSRQELKPGGTDKRLEFAVSLEGDVPPGYYNLRLVTEGGGSLPIVIGVDPLPQRPLAATADLLPVAWHGAATGSTVVETSFSGKKGDPVQVEIEAQRLGSKLRPVVHLYDARRRQLAWGWPRPALQGDARLEAILPEDGKYTVTLHDAEYAGAGPGFFRMKVGSWRSVDQVFPPVVGVGQSAVVELLGSGAQLQVAVPPQTSAGAVLLAWPAEGPFSGARPFVSVSRFPEFVERTGAGMVQDLPAGAVGVSGRLLVPQEEDRYRMAVIPGSKLRLEVFAERLGSPLDVALVVRNEQGGQLVRSEDGSGTLDPQLEYAIPDQMASVIVGVHDAQGRGGPYGVYRLVVEPVGSASTGGEFRLTTPAQRVSLPVGGRSVAPVWRERRGVSGEGDIEISATDLPPGVRLSNGTIPEGADGTLLTLTREEGFSQAAITHWRGRIADGRELPVLLTGHPQERGQPWLTNELGLAPAVARGADFEVEWRGLDAETVLRPASRLPLPVKLTRPADTSLVRLSLVTSQPPLILNGQPDPNRALRPEQPVVELAANVVEGAMSLLAPPDLPAPVYDVTVQADLLTADKRQVLATAYAPVRRMAVRMPIALELAGAPRVEARLDPQKGGTVVLRGKVLRRDGFAGEVPVSLSGLPAGAKADPMTVPPDADEFIVNLVLPANLPAGEVRGLKLSANVVPDPKQPAVRVKSRDVELILVVQPVVNSVDQATGNH